jgi:hypothetical protein
MPELLEEAMVRREKDKAFCKEFDEKIAAMVSRVTSMLTAPAVSPQLPTAGSMNRPLMEPYREAK